MSSMLSDVEGTGVFKAPRWVPHADKFRNHLPTQCSSSRVSARDTGDAATATTAVLPPVDCPKGPVESSAHSEPVKESNLAHAGARAHRDPLRPGQQGRGRPRGVVVGGLLKLKGWALPQASFL